MNIKENKVIFTGGILVLLLIIVSTIWNVQSAQKQTQAVAESVSDFYVEELANRRVTIISDALKQNFQYMNNALDAITKDDLQSITSLRNYLGRIRRLYGVEKFSFVDQDGLVYTAHSTTTGKSRYPFLEGLYEPLVTTVLNITG